MNRFELVDELISNQNPARAEKMENYMRNQFRFLGIQSVERREISTPFLKELRKSSYINWSVIDYLWNQSYRECQYIACDYLISMKNRMTPDDIPALRKLAENKPWWDTIDNLDKVIGAIGLTYPAVNDIMIQWSTDQNIWLRRIAINHQRHRRDLTDTFLLEKILVNNFGTDEFFINKAIGWILRDYSKTDPEWVSSFIERYEMKLHPLSIKEGSKHLSTKTGKKSSSD